MNEQRNMIMAIVASLAILLGYQYFFEMPRLERERATQAARNAATSPATGDATAPKPSEGNPVPPAADKSGSANDVPGRSGLSRTAALASGKRVEIQSPRVHGSISLQGGRLDDVMLRDYRETVDPDSPEIVLLTPQGTTAPYFAEVGWIAADKAVAVPGAATMWTADKAALTPSQPVTLHWNNGAGLHFERKFAIDENFMFTVTQRVVNDSGKAVTLYPYGLISRGETPKTLGFFILHEGPLGVVNGKLEEIKYKKLKESPAVEYDSKGGWVGITDHYWLTALVPNQQDKVHMRIGRTAAGSQEKYQVDFLGGAVEVNAGASTEAQSRIFAGAKEVTLIDGYRQTLGIDRFDLAIDFGWFFFLTKPFFHVLSYFHGMLGNFGLAILLLTVLIKLAFFPLANKSYVAMSAMKRVQPQMAALRERHKDDRAKLNLEMMELYKREKVNPAAGCLPILIQIPVFFALYKVLFVTIEMRHAPFYGWIRDLSAPDPTSILNLFGLMPWGVPELGFLNVLSIGIWPLIMGLSMFLQQKLNPQPADPVQARIFMIMPIMFTFLLGRFPAGLVIYWTWNNILSISQQWLIMRRAAAKN